MSTKNKSNLDPHLQREISKSRISKNEIFEMAVKEDKRVSIIAKVKDVQAFFALPGVYNGCNITLAPDKSGQIVTAEVSVLQLETLHQSPLVISLSSSLPLKILLKDTVNEIGIPSLESMGSDEGAGVVIGIIDYGCDFTHRNFRNRDGTTRLLSLMVQYYNNGSVKEVIHNNEQINAALNSVDPYLSLDYDPGYGSHGTHVMDIAVGNGLSGMSRGIATKADIIFVEPAYRDIPNGTIGNLGDSSNLLRCLKYVFQEVGNTPCVINISLGTNGGPHDGSTLVEQGIDGLLLEQANRAVVIAAGNSYDDNIHASGSVVERSYMDLHWEILKRDTTKNELEIWYSGQDEFQIELLNAENQSIFVIDIGEHEDLPGVFATHMKNDNGDHQAMIFINPNLAGQWTVRIHALKVVNGTFHAWIERDDNNRFEPTNQSILLSPVDNTYTLGSICCGKKSIVVGSYSAKEVDLPLSKFTSAGPTRDGRQKPEISAPGQSVLAAYSRKNKDYDVLISSGTSMAAPVVTGVIALMLAVAHNHHLDLSVDELQHILISTAKKNPPSVSGWDNRYGYGRIDAGAAIQFVSSLVPRGNGKG